MIYSCEFVERKKKILIEVKISGMGCTMLLFAASYATPASLGSNGNLPLCVSQELCNRD